MSAATRRDPYLTAFLVDRGLEGFSVGKKEDKLGIRASDTAAFVLDNCRVPATDLLGDPEIRTETGFGGAMQTFDNTRPLVGGMAVGVARAALEELRTILIDAGVEQGFIRKSGAWYTYEGDQLGQGKENVRTFLRDNPDLADEIEKKVKEKLGIGPKLDEPVTADQPDF